MDATIVTRIVALEAADIERHLLSLCGLLSDAVQGGALIGHILPLDRTTVDRYWRDVARSANAGERVVLAAMAGDEIIGTVQLYLSPEPNAPHRGEVYKLLVHSRHRNRGIGAALMTAAEHEARTRGRSLLLLDTVAGGAAERLYRRLGWQEIGVVPNHFTDPWGNAKASVYMMRHLDDA